MSAKVPLGREANWRIDYDVNEWRLCPRIVSAIDMDGFVLFMFTLDVPVRPAQACHV